MAAPCVPATNSELASKVKMNELLIDWILSQRAFHRLQGERIMDCGPIGFNSYMAAVNASQQNLKYNVPFLEKGSKKKNK